MKYFIYFAAIIILVGINTGLFPYIKFFGVQPNLPLLFLVGACLQRDAEDSFFIALCAGLFLDTLSGIFIGSFTFGFLLLALLLFVVIHRLVVFELSWKYLFAVSIFATVFTQACAWAINSAAFHYGWSQVSLNGSQLRNKIVFEIIYNLILAYPLYAFATFLKNGILQLQGKRHRIL